MKPFRLLLAMLLSSSFAFAQDISAPNSGGVREGAQQQTVDSIIPQEDASPLPTGITTPQVDPTKVNTSNPALNASIVPTTTASTDSGSSSNMGLIGGIIAACTAVAGSMFGGNNVENAKEVEDVSDAVDRYNDEQGFKKEADFDGSDIGEAIAANYPEGCENNFINKSGELGPWGRTALLEIREKEEEFVKNDPPDVLILCKNYKVFDKAKREKFWVWMFSSLAAPESSCKATAANKNAPNGTAIGLFQLEKPFCDRFGVTGNLYDPHKNTRCAVRGLAAELGRRENLMSPTSKASSNLRTYWGPLRTDDHNKARGGDVSGAKKFRSLVAKFPGCGR